MQNFKEFAVVLALQAGNIITKNHALGIKREWKEDATPLTEIDQKINQLVLDEIEKAFPKHAIIAEEGSKLKESDYAWVCDPIDGTIPFSHGWPTSVFALALTKNGESILGIIYDPYMKRMAVAEKGKGTTLNGSKVHVSAATHVKNTVVDIELWQGPYLKLNSLHAELTKNSCHTTAIRSMSYGALLVACGEIVAMFGSSPNPWDGAAAKIIVEEAGGRVTDLYGNEQLYNGRIKGVLATNGKLHEQLVSMITPLIQ